MKRFSFAAAAAVAALGLAACGSEPTAPEGPSLSVSGSEKTYVLDMRGSIPDGLADFVASSGGTLTGTLPQIGVAFATSSAPDFVSRAKRNKDIRSVTPDTLVQWVKPDPRVEQLEAVELSLGSDETFFNAQWAPAAISAPEAWDLGFQGQGARVAVLDGGIHSAHIDLVANLDVARSASFVPGQPFNFDQPPLDQPTSTFWHGTHVAGIIAAGDNAVGTIGIAPKATIIGVKVLHRGSGQFSWIINGIIYAATPIAEGGAGAHIINLSLGAGVFKSGNSASLMVALSKATNYARQHGVTVIAAAGNDAIDIDHTANLVFVPAQSTGVVSVSATGPAGFGFGATDFSRPASYTNFGQSAITLGGPGGDFSLLGTPAGNGICQFPRIPTQTPVLQFCWALDMVISTTRGTSDGSYTWAAGTSMAAPAVAGVAALLVGKNGPMHPAQLEAALRASADDLGQPGNDDFYGRGFVNALRAVQE